MNQQFTKLRAYKAPEAELYEEKPDGSFMHSSFTAGGNKSGGYIEDLGDTDTDAGNAIWN